LIVTKTADYESFGQTLGAVLNVGGTNILQSSLTYRTIANMDFSGQVETENIQIGSLATAYGYEYDPAGNITRITRTVGGTTSDLYRYRYDKAGQLIREDNSVSGQTTLWVYDAGGNIRTRKVYALTDVEIPLEQNLIDTVDYGYGDSIWKDKLTSYDGQTISYDASGNPTNYLGAAMTWTMGRQLASYDKGILSIDYTYNENGIRTSKTVNNVRTDYYLNGSQVIAEVTGGNRIDYRYDGNGQLIALRYNGSEYYYVTNIQGDVIGLIDGSGTSAVQYSYDAWGNQTSCTGTLASTLGQANPYRYRGYRFDTETGLYYLQSRYYDANVGRFVNADNLLILSERLLSKNLLSIYSYCSNNPINNIDTNGMFAIVIPVVVIYGIVIFILACGAILMLNDEKTRNSINRLWSDLTYGLEKGLRDIGGIITDVQASIRDQVNSLKRQFIDSFARTKFFPLLPRKNEEHHIVAQTEPLAQQSRDILKSVNLNTNYILNKIMLKYGLHRRLHTNAYYILVNIVMTKGVAKANGDNIKRRNNVDSSLKLLRALLLGMNEMSPY
jgi:RHS repeat-associated protein